VIHFSSVGVVLAEGKMDAKARRPFSRLRLTARRLFEVLNGAQAVEAVLGTLEATALWDWQVTEER
jgi:hypothetical protein